MNTLAVNNENVKGPSHTDTHPNADPPGIAPQFMIRCPDCGAWWALLAEPPDPVRLEFIEAYQPLWLQCCRHWAPFSYDVRLWELVAYPFEYDEQEGTWACGPLAPRRGYPTRMRVRFTPMPSAPPAPSARKTDGRR